MKLSKVYTYAAFLFLFIVLSCYDDGGIEEEPPVNEINILTIGDSRVQGNRPYHESYRYELWKNLVESNWTVDFLGPNNDQAEYPEFLGLEFDTNHAAVGGYTTRNVLNTIEVTLADVEVPDIILMGIGGIDLIRTNSYDEAVVNMHAIIDILQEHNPDVTIFMEQIAPAISDIYTEENILLFEGFNDAILTISEERSTEDSKVIAVDMAEGWQDFFLADDLHYNAIGAKVVADRYFDALEEHVE